MKLKKIIEFINKNIPQKLALDNDNIGFSKDYDLDYEINSIKIFMDLYTQYDENNENTLIITHHPPLFIPKTPTFTIHSNWDIIEGGANDALAKKLNLKVISVFDKDTNIGRICTTAKNFKEFKKDILTNFNNVTIVNPLSDDVKLNKIGIISGFGLKNPNYIKLASEYNLDILISGDLTQETGVLAKNLGITLINLGHHNSEIPGLYKLKELLLPLNIDCEVVNIIPWENI